MIVTPKTPKIDLDSFALIDQLLEENKSKFFIERQSPLKGY